MTIRTIGLIPSSVRNGRIYFPPTDHMFFPADLFGDRERSSIKGRPLTFTSGSRAYERDIRRYSGQRIGPRSDFAGFLASVGAVPAGSLRFTRTADREYLVEYIAPAAA